MLTDGSEQQQNSPLGSRSPPVSPLFPSPPMHLKLISCDLIEHQIVAAIGRSTNQVEVEFLKNHQHGVTQPCMFHWLQSRIDCASHGNYHAILLTMGSCSQRLSGLRARSIPLVLPKAADCISLLMERIARSAQRTVAKLDPSRSERAPNSGRNASNYWTVPVFSSKPVSRQGVAQEQNPWAWRARFGRGNRRSRQASRPDRPLTLLDMLIEGYWNYADFLVVPPGWRVTARPSEGAISAEEPV